MFSFLNKFSGSKKNQHNKTPSKVLSDESLNKPPQHPFNTSNRIINSNTANGGGGGGGILNGYFTTGRSVHHKKRGSLNLGYLAFSNFLSSLLIVSKFG
jgi:hypothetical protein